jgi:flagellar hook assembly protein FlgD
VAVRLAVYDGLGRLTRMLVDGPLSPGKNTAEWDGTTTHGSAASSGVYFIRLEAGGKVDGRRFVLIR